MWATRFIPLAIISVSIVVSTKGIEDEGSQCIGSTGKSQKTHISINLRRTEDGEWDTGFSAEKNSSLSSNAVDMDLTQGVVECSGHRIISIRGEMKGHSPTPLNATPLNATPRRSQLLFHYKCSPNAAISNGWRTLQKFKPKESATAFTDRPLMDDEIFSVRLDKKNSGYPLDIGVTSNPPGILNIPDYIRNTKSGMWIFDGNSFYVNETLSKTNYAKNRLEEAKVGDVFGVMRSESGNLHLFVNGVDQGPAAPVPDNVYGFVMLYIHGLEATIID